MIRPFSGVLTGLLAALAASLLIGAPPAHAQGAIVRILLDSQPGDPIGLGQRHEFDETGDTIETALGPPFVTERQMLVRVNGSGSGGWTMIFSRPVGSPWQAGMYSGANRFPSPYKPGIDAFGLGGGCEQTSGWYEIVEIEISGNEVQKLALDFVQHCGNQPPLFGAIRINSDLPLDRDLIYADAGADADSSTLEGHPIRLKSPRSYARGGDTLHYAWTQVSGPAAVIADPAAASTAITPPPGTADMQFELTVSDDRGRIDTDTVRAVSRGPQDLQSHLLVDSIVGRYLLLDPVGYDWVGGGIQRLLTSDSSLFGMEDNWGMDKGLWIYLLGDVRWNVHVAPTNSDEYLAPGSYEGAGRWPYYAGPSLDFYGDGRGCNSVVGRFDVLSVSYLGDAVQSIAVDFESHCGGTPAPALGRLRYNVVPAQLPVAHVDGFRFGPHGAGSYRFVPGNASVTLDATQSSDDGTLVSYQWQQIQGPEVVLDSSDADAVSFTAPPAQPDARTRLRFRLEVVDDAGNHGFEVTTVDVVADTSDADADGILDVDDDLPSDALEWQDVDGDGVGDKRDAFPLLPLEWADSDGDGRGDNSDAFPEDAAELDDNDQDGTGDNADPDDDNDGLLDVEEFLALNHGDGNLDGIRDSRQAHVMSFTDVTQGHVTVAAEPGTTLLSVAGVGNPNPSATPAGAEFQREFFSIVLAVAPGAAGRVTVRFDSWSAPPDAYWRYDAGDQTFYSFYLFDGIGSSVGLGLISLHFVDGGRGDADGIVNGQIVSLGAPKWGAATAPGNTAPVALAGSDRAVITGESAQLDGRSSYDPDQEALSYSWTQTSGPAATISNPASSLAGIVGPYVTTATTLVVTLTVTDARGGVSNDTVTVSVGPPWILPPLPDNSGGGGKGGSPSLLLLAGLALFGCCRRRAQ